MSSRLVAWFIGDGLVVLLADSWEKYVAFAGGVAKVTTYGAAEARLTPWVSSEWLDGLGTTWETRLLDPGSINKKPHVRKLFHLRNRLNCTIKWLIIFMHYKSMPGYVIYWCVPWVVGGSKEALWFSCWFLTHFPQTSEWTTSSSSFWILWFAAIKRLQWCFLLIHVWTFIQTNTFKVTILMCTL